MFAPWRKGWRGIFPHLAYPGAVEIQGDRRWEPEGMGRDIHGSDLSRPATRMFISSGAEVATFSVTYEIGHRGEKAP